MSSLQLICHMVTAADTIHKSLKVSASVIAVCLSSRGPNSLQPGKIRPTCARSKFIAALHLLHRVSLTAALLAGVTEPVKVTLMLQRSADWVVSSCLTAQKPCTDSAHHHLQSSVPLAIQPSTWEQTHSSSWSKSVSLQGCTRPPLIQDHAADCPCHTQQCRL